MKAAGSEVLLLLLPAGWAKRKWSLHSKEVWRPTAPDWICRVECAFWGFWIIYSSEFYISISRILIHACSCVHVCFLRPLWSSKYFGELCLHLGQACLGPPILAVGWFHQRFESLRKISIKPECFPLSVWVLLISKSVFPLSGIIHQMKGEYEAALRLHKAHLSFAQELSDYAAQGRAFGNMGNAYHAMGVYDQAVRYHRQELQISLEVSSLRSSPTTCSGYSHSG